MKTIIKNITLLLLGLFVFTSCKSEPENIMDIVASVPASSETVKELVDNNAFIDVDIKTIANRIADPSTRATVDEAEIAKIKAALYRFFSNVDVVDGFYKSATPDAEAINCSDQVYRALVENIDEMNSFIKKTRDSGEEIEVQVPGEAYLSSLLN